MPDNTVECPDCGRLNDPFVNATCYACGADL